MRRVGAGPASRARRLQPAPAGGAPSRISQRRQRRHRQAGRRAGGRAVGRTDVGALRGARVHGDDHAALEDEAQRGGAVVGLHVLHHLALERVQLQGRREGTCWGGATARCRRRRCRRRPFPAQQPIGEPQSGSATRSASPPSRRTFLTAGSGKESTAAPQKSPAGAAACAACCRATPASRQLRSSFSAAIAAAARCSKAFCCSWTCC